MPAGIAGTIRGNTIIFMILIAFLYYIGWTIQDNILLNQDVSWLMTASRRLLAGGSYTNDFFEINPPMILYLYIPPILLANFFQIILPTALRIYVFLLISTTLIMITILSKRYFDPDKTGTNSLFIITTTAVLLIAPVYTFGQREHLLVILIIPYLLLLAWRLNQSIPTTRPWSYYAFLIGLYAGVGFAIKPHFIFPLALIELYYLFKKRCLIAWIRPECIAIALVMMIYVTTTLIYHPDYLHTTLPFSMRFYYEGIRPDFLYVMLNASVIYCYFITILYFASYSKKTSPLNIVLFLTMLGLLLTYFIAKTDWFYHILPGYMIGIILSVLLVNDLLHQSNSPKLTYLILTSISVLCFVFLFPFYSLAKVTVILNPPLYYLYFGTIFIYVLATLKNNSSIIKILTACVFIIGIAGLLGHLTKHDDLQRHTFIITLLAFIASFWLSAKQLTQSPPQALVIALFSIIFFTFPVMNTELKYNSELAYKATRLNLIHFLEENVKNKSVFFFVTGANFAFPAVDYTNSQSVSRTQDLAWIPGLIKEMNLPLSRARRAQIQQDKDYLIKMVIDDLNIHQPDFIFVDTSTIKPHLNDIAFNHLNFFMQDDHFKAVWSRYRYDRSLIISNHYHFDIFKRINPNQESSQTTSHLQTM